MPWRLDHASSHSDINIKLANTKRNGRIPGPFKIPAVVAVVRTVTVKGAGVAGVTVTLAGAIVHVTPAGAPEHANATVKELDDDVPPVAVTCSA
jgi:hypothetical protein